jgi:gas vesicle protein
MSTSKTVAGVLVGIGIGTLIGILFAPDKGSQTRKKILNKGQGFADDLKDKLENIYNEAIDKYDTFVDETEEAIDIRK